MKNILLVNLFIVISSLGFSGEIELENKVLKNEKNNYHISTKIFGQDNPGVLRVTLVIPDEYTFKLFNDPSLIIDSRSNTVKFYTNLKTGNEIEINYQLSSVNDDDSEAIIPVHLEYSSNGEMIAIDKEVFLSQNTLVENKVMDSVTTHYEKISKKYENRDELAMARIKDLNSKAEEKSKKEEVTSVPLGYNSSSNSELNGDSKTYTVQILSLQYFNEERLNDFLSLYHLNSSDTYKKEINGMIKIYIGKYSSYNEAKSAKEKLIRDNNLTDSFIVSY